MATESNEAPGGADVPAPAPQSFNSLNAPVIYTDGVLAFGVFNGAGHFTLGAAIHTSMNGVPRPRTDISTVAHVRCSLQTVKDLRDAMDQILLLATPTQGQSN
jgi:hypothetical protein